jgi:hypothetical protein
MMTSAVGGPASCVLVNLLSVANKCALKQAADAISVMPLPFEAQLYCWGPAQTMSKPPFIHIYDQSHWYY